jgi:hypothetical protein
MKTASLQTPFAYNLMNGDECYESMRSEVVSRRGRRGDTRRLTTPCGEDRYFFFFPRKPLEEMGASYILMNAGTGRSCKILLAKNGALCFFTSVLRFQNRTSIWIFAGSLCSCFKGLAGGLRHDRLCHDRPSVTSRKLRRHLQLLVATTR